jgi:hypothetical protein
MAAPTLFLVKFCGSEPVQDLQEVEALIGESFAVTSRPGLVEAFLIGNTLTAFVSEEGFEKLVEAGRCGVFDYVTFSGPGLPRAVVGHPGAVLVFQQSMKLGGGFASAWRTNGSQVLGQLIRLVKSLPIFVAELVALRGDEAIESFIEEGNRAIERVAQSEFEKALAPFGCSWAEWRAGRRRLSAKLGFDWLKARFQ